MKKELSIFKKGFSLVEILLSLAVFVMVVGFLGGAFIYGEESIIISGDRTKALFLANEGMDAAKIIRDRGFDNLADGVYGINVAANRLGFVPGFDVTDGYTRRVEIVSTGDKQIKKIISKVDWERNNRKREVVLETYLSNWRAQDASPIGQSQFFSIDTGNASLINNDEDISGTIIGNLGESPIVLDKIAVTWSGGSSANKVDGISINGASVWIGVGNSGQQIDINNFVLDPGKSYPINFISFKKSILGSVVGIDFIMSDGSSKSLNNISF